MEPIIKSLLDLDLYKLTVLQIIFNLFSNIEARYEFTCRNKEKLDLLRYVPEDELREQLFKHLATLKLTDEEYRYVLSKGYYSKTFAQYLYNFRFLPEEQLTVKRDEENRTYRIIANGPWAGIILYETLVLSIVNEIFARNYTKNNKCSPINDGIKHLSEKICTLTEYNVESIADGFDVPKLLEFGTRRRYSQLWQKNVIKTLITDCPHNLIGTSNVAFSKEFNIKEIGSFGHELPMGLQGLYPVQHSQRQAFKIWLSEYRGQWGTALTDTLGDARFFKDFSFELAKGFDSCRHDSGDPFIFGEKIVCMYENYDIDPLTKRLLFSDGLNFDTMIKLHRRFRGRIGLAFGIGTDLTNHMDIPVPQVVMKITMANSQDVCKLSANPAKASCNNQQYLDYVRMAIERY